MNGNHTYVEYHQQETEPSYQAKPMSEVLSHRYRWHSWGIRSVPDAKVPELNQDTDQALL